MMNIEIYSEAEISWQLHNEIHAVLNRAYAHRTNAFRCKTYGGIQPLKRVIFRDQGMIVGHTAIFGTQVRFEDEWINVGGVGMTCSLQPLKKLGVELRRVAIAVCAELGYPLVLGRIKNKVNIKKSIEALIYACLDIPLVGIDKRSHEWESIAIYDPQINLNLLKSLVQYFIAKQKIDISTAIF